MDINLLIKSINKLVTKEIKNWRLQEREGEDLEEEAGVGERVEVAEAEVESWLLKALKSRRPTSITSDTSNAFACIII